MPYSIFDHRHRYAAWAASRAASTKSCRFEVFQGKEIVEAVGLQKLIPDANHLPEPPEVDARHREWRDSAIVAANARGLIGFSHGVAAKLINVYLKGVFVCGGYEAHPSVQALHPPIDSLLLDALYAENFGGLQPHWRTARKLRWSKLNSEQYEAVISAIRQAMGTAPLWQVEEHWRGHQ